MKKVSILYFPNYKKKSKKTSLTPIYIRIGGNIVGKKTEANIDIYLNDKELSLWNPIVMRVDAGDCHANKLLNKLDNKIEDLKIKHYPDFNKLTPLEIKDGLIGNRINNNSPKEILLLDYINHHYTEVVLPNTNFVRGTKKNYKKSINHLTQFLTLNKLENIKLKEFTVRDALKFKDYLFMDLPLNNKKPLVETSAASIAKTLKVIFNRAVDEEILEKSSFSKLKFKLNYIQKPRLSGEELGKIAALDLSANNSLAIYRDMFLFSIYTGLSYSDAHDLKKSDITETGDGYLMATNRLKTKINVRQFLIQPAVDLLKKYNSHIDSLPFNHVFPPRCLTKLNFYLKFIGTLCGIEKNLSSHVARHTCMQNIAEAGIEDIQVRNKILGWSSNKLTSTTYYHVTDSRLLNAKNKLENYLNKFL